MTLSYILNQLGEDKEHYFNAITPPIIQSSNFSFSPVNDLRKAFQNEQSTHLYTRGNNPTVEILRKKIAAMAGAEDALVLASGAAALSAAVISQVQQGDHIIFVQKPYGWTEKLCRIILARFGVTTTFIDGTNINNFQEAVQPNTRLVILESPNTFTFELQDLKEVAAFAKQRNITTIIDNTYCTPIGQKCLEMGIDIEVHSASKYLNGHSDIVAGIVISSASFIHKIFQSEFLNLGAIISPNDSWLMLRGLRTLPLRLAKISKSTLAVVEFMEQHPKIEKVLFPFSTSFPQYELAKKQMNWCGGLFSAYLNAKDVKSIEKFCEQLHYFKMAVSWGGHESLLMPSCAFYPENFAGERTYCFNLVRFYIGLEDEAELLEDLANALNYL